MARGKIMSALKSHEKLIKACFWILMSPIFVLIGTLCIQTLLESGQIVGTLLRHLHELGTITC